MENQAAQEEEIAGRQPISFAAVAVWIVRHGSRPLARWKLELQVDGRERLPATGPAIIACRHFHHVWDGVALQAVAPRPLCFLIALDWVRSRAGRSCMERAAAVLGWPVIIRDDGPASHQRSAYSAGESKRYLRRATRDTVAHLRAGRMVVVFPEAYPNVDSVYTIKTDMEAFLPFRPGFVKLVEWAQHGGQPIAVIPAGLRYRVGRHWKVRLRFGSPMYLEKEGGEAFLRRVEKEVRVLSGEHE